MRTLNKIWWGIPLLLIILGVASCALPNDIPEPNPEQIWHIASKLEEVKVEGEEGKTVMAMKVLNYPYKQFYLLPDQIEGFTYEEGYEYKIKVWVMYEINKETGKEERKIKLIEILMRIKVEDEEKPANPA